MKKYYIIKTKEGYLKPLSTSVHNSTNNIDAAGSWESEEKALAYINGIAGIEGYRIEILFYYVKYS